MQIDEYQEFTPTTWVYGSNLKQDIDHALCGLFAEAGEVAAAYQKFYRKDYGSDILLDRVQKELGGLMYYISQLCNVEGIRISDVLSDNAAILKDRQERNVIRGDGDDR